MDKNRIEAGLDVYKFTKFSAHGPDVEAFFSCA